MIPSEGQNLPFGRGNGSFRIEDAFGAAAEQRGASQDNGEYGVPHIRPRLR
jgi:hypothetical protein